MLPTLPTCTLLTPVHHFPVNTRHATHLSVMRPVPPLVLSPLAHLLARLRARVPAGAGDTAPQPLVRK